MTRPKILTSDFWARRIDAVTDSVRPAVRAGANAVLLSGAQDALGLNVFDADWRTLAGAFVGGAVIWVLTTLAAPPKPATTTTPQEG